MKNTRSDKKFTTSNFYLSAFLLVKGFELLSVNDTGSRRSDFVFADLPEIRTMAGHFFYARENSQEIMVDVRLLSTAIRNLKEKLYQNHQ